MEVAIIPRFIIRRFFDDDKKQIHANVGLSSFLLILIIPLLSVLGIESISIPHFCLFQAILHTPCPGCGITSSIFSIAYGDVSSALNHNPAGLVLCGFILAQIPLRVVALRRQSFEQQVLLLSRAGNLVVVISLFAAWFRNII